MDSETLLVAIGRLEGKVDSLIASFKVHSETLSDHDARLRSLEQGRAWVLGASAMAGAVASILVKLVGGVSWN